MERTTLQRSVLGLGFVAIVVVAIGTIWNRVACRVLGCCP